MYKRILKQYWGYDSFRGIQEDIIQSICSGKDTLGLMPTGGGKSITFQVPTMAMEGMCLVITPLIALMKDQVQNLRRRGIKAQAIHSGMPRDEILFRLDNCIYGDYKFLYISPERIGTEMFRAKLRLMNICFITVDESHCISQWGYDFRPSYLKIAEIRKLIPDVPVLALTATATPEVVKDIQARLLFKEENVFRMSFERKNLAYVVRETSDKQQELVHILQRVSGSAIVYVRSRRRTKEVAEMLRQNGISADFYHAGLDDATRTSRQHQWVDDRYRVIVATNAFGMGIDKPDVRLVIHIDLPDAIEAYFQEAGRAGRDGEKSYAILLYNKSDVQVLHRRIPDTFPTPDYIREVYEDIQYYFQMAIGDGEGCIKSFDIEDFCKTFRHFPVPVDSALKLLTQAGYIEYRGEQDDASRLMFTLSREELYRLRDVDEQADRLIQTTLRTYTGLFTDYAFINESSLATRSGLTLPQVYEILIRLSRMHIISYIPHKRVPAIYYTLPRIDTHRIQLSKDIYEDRQERMKERVEAMLAYAQNSTTCRSRLLLHYFGEDNPHNCGICDTCIKHRKEGSSQTNPSPQDIRQQILTLLESQPHTPAQLASRIHASKDSIVDAIRHLLDKQRIALNNGMLSKKQ